MAAMLFALCGSDFDSEVIIYLPRELGYVDGQNSAV
jgi:hypothetical protein